MIQQKSPSRKYSLFVVKTVVLVEAKQVIDGQAGMELEGWESAAR